MKNYFNENLYQMRVLKRISQEEVAIYAGITKSAVSKYERGAASPTLDVAKKIAEFFSVTVDYMVSSPNANSEKAHLEYTQAIKFAIDNNISAQKLIELMKFARSLEGADK